MMMSYRVSLLMLPFFIRHLSGENLQFVVVTLLVADVAFVDRLFFVFKVSQHILVPISLEDDIQFFDGFGREEIEKEKSGRGVFLDKGFEVR